MLLCQQTVRPVTPASPIRVRAWGALVMPLDNHRDRQVLEPIRLLHKTAAQCWVVRPVRQTQQAVVTQAVRLIPGVASMVPRLRHPVPQSRLGWQHLLVGATPRDSPQQGLRQQSELEQRIQIPREVWAA